jgi:putative FmdB family regulatory protein
MPIYEYDCQNCGTVEVTQRITEKPLSKCPACKGKVKKLISNTSFQLKGSGWYVTDYARKGQNGESKSRDGEKSTNSTTESKDSKTESKSASKKSESPSSSSVKPSSSAPSSTSA